MSKLAIDGGKPVRNKSWAPWPIFSSDEIDIVTEVLKSGKVNYWTGEYFEHNGLPVRGWCGKFEHSFSDYLGSKYSVAVANGTLALELCLFALNIGKGDEVIVPNRTFIASASACIAQGATPVFADIDPESQNICLETIKKALTPNTKAIICVHLAGWPCEMEDIMSFARENNLKVIEDCAQSLGAKLNGKMLGTFGDMSAFSFCQDKILTTGGEGGMVVTNNEGYYLKAWEYKDHGKNFHFFNKSTKSPLIDESLEKARGMYSTIGTNFRMTEMQAAIGCKQLEKLPNWIEKRRANAKILIEGFSRIKGLKIFLPSEKAFHCYYKFYAFLDLEKVKPEWTREKIIDAISAEGVVCQYGSTWAIGKEHGWSQTKLVDKTIINLQLKDHLPNDLLIGTSAIMFQVHPTLDKDHLRDTVNAVEKVMAVAVL